MEWILQYDFSNLFDREFRDWLRRKFVKYVDWYFDYILILAASLTSFRKRRYIFVSQKISWDLFHIYCGDPKPWFIRSSKDHTELILRMQIIKLERHPSWKYQPLCIVEKETKVSMLFLCGNSNFYIYFGWKIFWKSHSKRVFKLHISN